ncbi:CIC11C00000001604 [Sungouiella intermedia]|uniref:CIC11C00000001604 n=1 Tax=Sungouiella intermedia TaxID=45354 RepID=A0A1L0C5J7_9ASCO|nr:CIC11C00000001604 [[Candida] intermedia]
MKSSVSLDDKPITEHVSRISDDSLNKTDRIHDVMPVLDVEANDATETEHALTIREALKTHTWAVLWSAVMSATIIMEGYDNILIGSFYAYPSFQKKYGQPTHGDETNYQLTGPWQVGLSTASTVGIIITLIFNGWLVEKFGHRQVIMVSLLLMGAFIFITFFATSLTHLLIGQILCGIPWGIFATMGPTYSSEIAPLALRGQLLAYVNMCWAIGQFIAAGVLKGLVENKTQWSYRIPFAVQWVWIPPLFILTWLAPDSPWWLVRKGRIEDAKKVVRRITNKSIHNQVEARVALMIRTTELEREQERLKSADKENSGWRAYLRLFQGPNRRRTEIACIAFAGQVLSGSTFAYSPSYFFSQAGLALSEVYKLNLGTTAIAFTGTLCSWFLLHRFGRRTIYVTGYAVLVTLLLLIGILAFPAKHSSGVKWAQAAITICWVGTYSLTIGPLAFTIVSEISATNLRSQSIALARNSYNLCSLISNVVEPYLMNPGNANLKGKTAFVWFGTAFPTLIWAFFRLPETKGRTYEELDLMFERDVPTRQFAEYKIEAEELHLSPRQSIAIK